MPIVVITETLSDLEGVVADMCGTCQAPREFLVSHRYRTRSIQGVRVGKGHVIDVTRQCTACGQWWDTNTERYSKYLSPYDEAEGRTIDALLEQTHPRLVRVISDVEALCAPTSAAPYREAAHDEVQVAAVRGNVMWLEAFGGNAVPWLASQHRFWDLSHDERAARIRALEDLAIGQRRYQEGVAPRVPATRHSRFRRAFSEMVIAATAAAVLAGALGIALVRLTDVIWVPMLLVGAIGGLGAGAWIARRTVGTRGNVVMGGAMASLAAAFVAAFAHAASHEAVWVDNPSAADVTIRIDGVERGTVAAGSREKMYVKRGRHRFSSFTPTGPIGEPVEADIKGDVLYNPGMTGQYWLHTTIYGRAPNGGGSAFEDGPIEVEELYLELPHVDHFFEDNPEEVSSDSGSTSRVSLQRDPLGMQLGACSRDVRDAWARCARRGLFDGDVAVKVCWDRAKRTCGDAARP